jgi:hypothetical protein
VKKFHGMTDDDVIHGFLEEEVRKLAAYAVVQDLLVGASPSNLFLTNVRLAEVLAANDPCQIPDLCHLFIVAAKFRHQNIPTLVSILEYLIERSDIPDAKSRYARHLLPSFTRTNSRLVYRHRFIVECVKQEILSGEAVVAAIRVFVNQWSHLVNEHRYLSQWYSPLIKQYDPALADSLEIIGDNDLHAHLVEYGYARNTIEFCIRTDDVAGFQDLLLANGSSIDSTITHSIFEPAFLLDNRPYYIHFAVYYGSLRCLKFMLLNNVDIGRRDSSMVFTPQFAAAGGNGEIIRLLEQRRCYFNGAQQIAALFHRNQVFDWLNENIYSVMDYNDPYLGSILIQAVIGNNLSIFLYLLQHLEIRDIVGFLCKDHTIYRSVLQSASEHGHTAMIRFILSRPGLDINARNHNLNTAAHFAAYFGSFEALELLINYQGIDLTLKDRVLLVFTMYFSL